MAQLLFHGLACESHGDGQLGGEELRVLAKAVFIVLPEGWVFLKGCRWVLWKISLVLLENFGLIFGRA